MRGVSLHIMDLRIEASAKEIAVKYGALSLAEIIKWADTEIMNSEDPDSSIYDLSLSRTLGDALAILNAMCKSNKKAEVSKRSFSYFYEYMKLNKGYHQKIAKALYDMAMQGIVPTPEAEGAMWSFWDSLDLAIDGIYGDPDQINQEMIEFIQKYMG